MTSLREIVGDYNIDIKVLTCPRCKEEFSMPRYSKLLECDYGWGWYYFEAVCPHCNNTHIFLLSEHGYGDDYRLIGEYVKLSLVDIMYQFGGIKLIPNENELYTAEHITDTVQGVLAPIPIRQVYNVYYQRMRKNILLYLIFKYINLSDRKLVHDIEKINSITDLSGYLNAFYNASEHGSISMRMLVVHALRTPSVFSQFDILDKTLLLFASYITPDFRVQSMLFDRALSSNPPTQTVSYCTLDRME